MISADSSRRPRYYREAGGRQAVKIRIWLILPSCHSIDSGWSQTLNTLQLIEILKTLIKGVNTVRHRFSPVLGWAAVLAMTLAWEGCVRFDPQPLSAAKNIDAFQERSLGDLGLKDYL